MGGGDLNMKKSWHPLTIKNAERVWKLEQKKESETQKIDELKKELQSEREREDIKRFAEEAGAVEKKSSKLEWMYQGPQVDREAYLLGKAIDKTIVNEVIGGEGDLATPSTSNPGALFTNNTTNTQVDMMNKVKEDPLFMIRKMEEENKKKLLTNPVKMKQLQSMLDSMKHKSKSKKHKTHKSSSAASDTVSAGGKYNRRDRHHRHNDDESSDEISSRQDRKHSKSSKYDKKHSKSSLQNGSYPHNNEEPGNGKKQKTSRNGERRADVSRNGTKLKMADDTSSDDDNHKDRTRSYNNSRSYTKDTEKKVKSKYEKSSERTDKYHRKVSAESGSDSGSKRRKRDSSPHRAEKKSRKRKSSSSDERMEDKKTRKTDRRRKVSPDSSSSSDSTVDPPVNSTSNRKKTSSVPSKNTSSKDKKKSKKRKNSSSSDDVDDKKTHRTDRRRKTSPESSSSSDTSDPPDDKTKTKVSNYGLLKKSSAAHTTIKPKLEESKIRTGSPSPVIQKPRPWRGGTKKFDPDEMERKRREMMDNAKWRDEHRETRVKKFRAQDETERDDYEKSKTRPADFLDTMRMPTSGSLEHRVKSKINSLQRTAVDTDKFMKR